MKAFNPRLIPLKTLPCLLLLLSACGGLTDPGGGSVRAIPLEPVQTVYVAPSGSDLTGMGTYASPLGSLTFAAASLEELQAEEIVLSAGIYREKGPVNLPPEVSLSGAGPTETRIESVYSEFLIVLESAEGTTGNQTLSNFTLDGCGRSLYGGIWIEGRSGVTLRNLTLKDIDEMGVVIINDREKSIPEEGNWASDILVESCIFENTAADLETYSTGNLNIGGLDGAIIRNIEITDDEGYGIKFHKDGYLKNVVIEDAVITLNEDDELWGEDIAVELWNFFEGNRISNVRTNTWISLVNYGFFSPDPGAENIVLENCRIESLENNSTKEGVEIGAKGAVLKNNYIAGKGFGIALWNAVKENVLIQGNIIRDMKGSENSWNGGAGIFIANSTGWDYSGIQIAHNVFDQMPWGIWFKQESTSSTLENLQVDNNCFVNIDASPVRVSGSLEDLFLRNNLADNENAESAILQTDSGSTIDVLAEEGTLFSFPAFSASGDYTEDYYHPVENSPLIDQGFDTGLFIYNGSAPDIGAYEY